MPQTFHQDGQYDCTAEEMVPARNSNIILSDSVDCFMLIKNVIEGNEELSIPFETILI